MTTTAYELDAGFEKRASPADAVRRVPADGSRHTPTGPLCERSTASLEWTWPSTAARVPRWWRPGLRGIGRATAVALAARHRPEFHVVDAAALHLGAIAFSVYPTTHPSQIRSRCSRTPARRLLVTRAIVPRAGARGARPARRPRARRLLTGRIRHEPSPAWLAPGARRIRLRGDVARGENPDAGRHDRLHVRTTGAPKGVQHPHAGLLYGIEWHAPLPRGIARRTSRVLPADGTTSPSASCRTTCRWSSGTRSRAARTPSSLRRRSRSRVRRASWVCSI